MAPPYSLDLREHVVGLVAGGKSRRAVAAFFDVSGEACKLGLFDWPECRCSNNAHLSNFSSRCKYTVNLQPKHSLTGRIFPPR